MLAESLSYGRVLETVDMGGGLYATKQEAGNPSAGYFDAGRALAGGGVFDRFIPSPGSELAINMKNAWPIWLGVVGVGAAVVVITRGKK